MTDGNVLLYCHLASFTFLHQFKPVKKKKKELFTLPAAFKKSCFRLAQSNCPGNQIQGWKII